jgi:hypothetical protein
MPGGAIGRWHRVEAEQERLFFFEKKNQKTFIPHGRIPRRGPGHRATGVRQTGKQKVFWFFFSKKNDS